MTGHTERQTDVTNIKTYGQTERYDEDSDIWTDRHDEDRGIWVDRHEENLDILRTDSHDEVPDIRRDRYDEHQSHFSQMFCKRSENECLITQSTSKAASCSSQQ